MLRGPFTEGGSGTGPLKPSFSFVDTQVVFLPCGPAIGCGIVVPWYRESSMSGGYFLLATA